MVVIMEKFLDKDVRISVLADIYGKLITPRQLTFLREYYDEDLSYAEIAEKHGVARQTVKDSLTSAADSLNDYESKLMLLSRFTHIKRGLTAISESFPDSAQLISTLLKQIDV